MSFARPILRVATAADVDAVTAVMRASVLELFPRFYDERQTASAAVHVAHVDPALIADGVPTSFTTLAARSWPAEDGARRGRLYTDRGHDA